MMYSKRLMAVPDSTPALLRLDLGSRRDGLGLQELRTQRCDSGSVALSLLAAA